MTSRRVLASATATTNTMKMSQPSRICIANAPASSNVSVMGKGKPAKLKITNPVTIKTNTGAGRCAAACSQASPFMCRTLLAPPSFLAIARR